MSLNNIEALDSTQIRARGNVFNLGDVIRRYRVLLIGLPGAFTPVDTNVYMPQLFKALPYLDQRLDYIFCIIWNDPFVTKSWVVALDIPKKIKVISDWNGYVTRSLGMEMDASEYYLGPRSKRYAAIYDTGSLLWCAEADDAYPKNIIGALDGFKLLRPSRGKVDPCSRLNLYSPKSKFSPANFRSVSSESDPRATLPEEKVTINKLDLGKIHNDSRSTRSSSNNLNSDDAPHAPQFKNRFGSPRTAATVASRSVSSLPPRVESMWSSESEGGAHLDRRKLVESWTDEDEEEDVADPARSPIGSRDRPRPLRLSSHLSSESALDLIEMRRAK
eukprot:GHVH01005471.1.p1 GENE.GHVH01005471.1~~GHVH01005471.1.p1  ORF type:complete len:332 (+),score=34.08 GHVH01005471.1:77-1072(+)